MYIIEINVITARTLGLGEGAFWTGFNLGNDGGTWKWSDRSPMVYFNWAEGESKLFTEFSIKWSAVYFL